MFTGIVTDQGTILAMEQAGDLSVRIGTGYDVSGIDLGASIACDGVCLTVVDLGTDPQNWFEVQASAETLAKSNLGDWAVGRVINLERALKVGDELGGHIVSGHVDGVATVVEVRDEGDSTRVVFEAPADLARFIAPKGSVALNGTSLTVNEVDGARFGVNFIPHTKEVTTWGRVAVGDRINLEIDTLARYVARLAEAS
ncbi:MAG: riboflavin synthase [Paracoccaceae bacterium]|nr:riboflavin synthase [Paracoccaceae bacterium]